MPPSVGSCCCEVASSLAWHAVVLAYWALWHCTTTSAKAALDMARAALTLTSSLLVPLLLPTLTHGAAAAAKLPHIFMVLIDGATRPAPNHGDHGRSSAAPRQLDCPSPQPCGPPRWPDPRPLLGSWWLLQISATTTSGSTTPTRSRRTSTAWSRTACCWRRTTPFSSARRPDPPCCDKSTQKNPLSHLPPGAHMRLCPSSRSRHQETLRERAVHSVGARAVCVWSNLALDGLQVGPAADPRQYEAAEPRASPAGRD